MEDQLNELTVLLKQAIALYAEDRKIAIENYEDFRKQLDDILSVQDQSEEAGIEGEVNKALKLVFESGKRLDAVIQTVAKIIMTQMHSESREKAAALIAGKDPTKPIDGPINITGLLEQASEEITTKTDD